MSIRITQKLGYIFYTVTQGKVSQFDIHLRNNVVLVFTVVTKVSLGVIGRDYVCI
jgi:hypothetical protein